MLFVSKKLGALVFRVESDEASSTTRIDDVSFVYNILDQLISFYKQETDYIVLRYQDDSYVTTLLSTYESYKIFTDLEFKTADILYLGELPALTICDTLLDDLDAHLDEIVEWMVQTEEDESSKYELYDFLSIALKKIRDYQMLYNKRTLEILPLVKMFSDNMDKE